MSRLPKTDLPSHLSGVSLLPILAVLAVLSGCGGDHSQAPDTQQPATVYLDGSIAMPEGYPVPMDSLRIVDGLEEVALHSDGAFRIGMMDASGQLGVVTGPDGGPLLLGWMDGAGARLDARSTAETLAWFSMGAWLLSPDDQDRARALIASSASALDPLVASIEAELLLQPRGLSQPSPEMKEALANVLTTLVVLPSPASASADLPGPLQAKGIVIDPSAEQSGVALLNQGGINKITLRNSYRRRVQVFVTRTGWFDAGDSWHDVQESARAFEMPAVSGFAGTVNTIGSYFTDQIAYTPVTSDPVVLDTWPGSKITTYAVTIGGAGPRAGNEDWLTQAEKEQVELVELKTLVWDLFVPLFLNIGATANQLKQADFALDVDEGVSSAGLSFINYCKDTVPAMMTHVQEGHYSDAVMDLYTAAATSDDFRQRLYVLITAILQRVGWEDAAIGEVFDAADKFLNYVGWIDIVGSYLDSIITISHIRLSHHADVWTLRVTEPSVHATVAPGTIAQYDEVDSLWVRVADAPDEPEGWAFAYRWRCGGSCGTLVDPKHPDDRDNDLTTSSAAVSYLADRGTSGTERIVVSVSIRVGETETPVGTDTVSVEVTPRSVLLTPSETNVAADAVRWFEVQFDPVLPPDADVVYAWSGGGSVGTLRSADGTAAPCETGDASATYHAGMGAGDDVVSVSVFRIVEGGGHRPIGSATATAHVRPDMIEGRLIGLVIFYPDEQRVAGPVYVEFAKKPGVTRYLVHGYNYEDWTGYYGNEYRRVGPPFDAWDTETETVYRVFLTGLTTGYDPNHPPSDEEMLGSNLGRFRGSVWEVWPRE